MKLWAAEPQSDRGYFELKQDSRIYAKVGDIVQMVGGIYKDRLLQTEPFSAEKQQFAFGNDRGFISKEALRPLSLKRLPQYPTVRKQIPSINLNLITTRSVNIYSEANRKAPAIGWLAENLRYPISARLVVQDQQWYEISLAGQKGYIAADECELDQGIPVLTFHHILQDSENKKFRHTSTTTTVVAFTRQIEFLRQQGYQTISAYELESYLNNRINLPGKAVLLTFDDGLKSVYRYAYPVLKRLGFEGTLFIISSRIKRHFQTWNPNSLQFLSVSELEQMQDIFDTQSHTHFMHRVTKYRQPILLSRSYHNILFDFEHSRRALEQFNPRVLYLSYPFGGYNKLAINAAKEAGFHMAFTTVQGKVRPGDNPYTLKRLYILSTDSLAVMAQRLGNERNVAYSHAGGEM